MQHRNKIARVTYYLINSQLKDADLAELLVSTLTTIYATSTTKEIPGIEWREAWYYVDQRARVLNGEPLTPFELPDKIPF